MHIQRGIKFLLHKRAKGQDKHLSIRMRVTLHGQPPIDIPTGHHIDLCDWDVERQHALPTCESADSINRTIDEWNATLNEIFARYELLEKRIPAIGEVKDLFNDMVGRKTAITKQLPSPDEDLFRVFDIFTETMGKANQWTDSTFEKFAAIRRHLKNFDAHLSFHQVDEAKMQQYVTHLGKAGLKNTTIAKNLAFVRWFFRWAAKYGYYTGDIHDSFKPKLKGISVDSKEIIFLTKDEVKALQNYQFAPNEAAMERVCDVFLFCCFTGLRFSDAAKLKKSDVKNGFIRVVTQKTVDGLTIELNKHSQAILDKYRDADLPNDMALPVISNEKTNAHLKIIGQVCGLNEPTRIVYFRGNQRFEEVYPKWALLTTHCARRTFVVTALQLGIPAEIIIRWTGHANYNAMKPYVKIVDELKEKSMSLFDDL